MRTPERVCDHNCFECPHQDCIADDMTAEEYRESVQRDRDTHLTDSIRKQRAYYEANREKIADQQRAYREARRWAGLKQKEVAAALGITQQAYSFWETGSVPSDYGTVMGAIAKLAGCSVEMLEKRPLLI